MTRLIVALAVVLAASAALAQETRSDQPRQPAMAGVSDTRPFLFDGRMRGDGHRDRALPAGQASSAGAVTIQPETMAPARH